MWLTVVLAYLVSTLGWNFQESYSFPDKRKAQVAWPLPITRLLFLPAWVTEATPGGRVTLLQNRLKPAVGGSGTGDLKEPGSLVSCLGCHTGLPPGLPVCGLHDLLISRCCQLL